MKPLKTTVEEVLRKAIQDEIDSREQYLQMALAATSVAAKARLQGLAEAQILHRLKLERKYRDLVGAEPPEPQPPQVDIPADAENIDLARALKIALEHERESESNYRFLAERVPDTELGALFLELAEWEWDHKVEIQQEYDALDPERFLMDLGGEK